MASDEDALAAGNARQRIAAIHALVASRGASASPALLARLRVEKARTVCEFLLRALLALGASAQIDEVRRGTLSSRQVFFQALLRVQAEQQDPAAIPSLLRLLGSRKPAEGAWAERALAAYGVAALAPLAACVRVTPYGPTLTHALAILTSHEIPYEARLAVLLDIVQKDNDWYFLQKIFDHLLAHPHRDACSVLVADRHHRFFGPLLKDFGPPGRAAVMAGALCPERERRAKALAALEAAGDYTEPEALALVASPHPLPPMPALWSALERLGPAARPALRAALAGLVRGLRSYIHGSRALWWIERIVANDPAALQGDWVSFLVFGMLADTDEDRQAAVRLLRGLGPQAISLVRWAVDNLGGDARTLAPALLLSLEEEARDGADTVRDPGPPPERD